MKRLVVLFVAVVLTFAMSSCKKNGASTPSDAVKAYYEYLQKGDFKSALQNCSYEYNKEMTAEEKETSDAMLEMTANKIEESMKEKGGMASFEILSENVEGETAEVEVKTVYGNGEEETVTESAIKSGDVWFVK